MDLLRARLGELERDKELHFGAIDSIRPKFGHTMELIDSYSVTDRPNFNCVIYALELRDWQLLDVLANTWDVERGTDSRRNDRCISADTEFLEFCIDEGPMPSISDREPRPGDLLVYSNERECCHIGKAATNGRISSKWGTNDLLNHKPLEVPDFFGDDLQYLESLTGEQSRELFIEYARSVVKDDPCVKKYLEHEINTHW